jgi:VCBS repeat-containing protein
MTVVRSAALTLLLIASTSAFAAPITVWMDADQNPATGCMDGGVAGAETRWVFDGATATRHDCVSGTWSAATMTWAAGTEGTTQIYEASMDQTGLPPLRFAMENGSEAMVATPPAPPARRPAAGPVMRTITIDGRDEDWDDLTALMRRDGVALWIYRTTTTLFLLLEIQPSSEPPAPTAVNDTYDVMRGGSLTVPAPGLLSNDSDPDGLPLSVTGTATPPTHGIVTINPDGSFVYSHDGALFPTDQFDYTITNGSATASATATLNVTQNVPPMALDDSYTVDEGGTLNVPAATGVLANDTDPDDTTFTVTPASQPSHGTLTLLDDGSFTYVHDGSEFPSDSFSYNVFDGVSQSTANVSITITPVNDGPVLTAGGTLAYTENSPAAVADATVTVSDVDSALITGATVQISGNYQSGADVLSFATLGPISGLFNPATGTLTLTGSDSPANYQAALRTVRYQNTSDAPSTAPRVLTWSATDGTTPGAGVTSNITVTATNDGPVLTAGGVLAYTENQAATAIDGTITIADVDSASMVGATASITGNLASGEDVLSFIAAAGISGSYNAGTGVLTLSGSATMANYQAALRSVAYSNTSENPSTLARTITWQVHDGGSLSNTATSTVNVSGVNDAPAVNAAAALAYVEGDGAVVIDPALTVSDADHTQLGGATVQITGGYVNGQDVLAFVNNFGITGSFDAPSGTLTLTGTATVADYQSALRTVTYANPSNAPSTAARTVTWTVSDPAPAGGSDTTTINITSVNTAPTLTVTGAVTHTEGGALTNVAATANITDPDDTMIESAAVRISANFAAGQDVLSFTNTAAISGAFAGDTLTLTGTDTLANYIAALQAVQYTNTSDAPSTLQRTLTWTVHDGDVNSNPQTTTLDVTPTNDAPVIAAGSTRNYTENDAPVVLEPGLTITDPDSTTVQCAAPNDCYVQVTGNGDVGNDVLSCPGCAGLGITATWNPLSLLLSFTGAGTIADYQSAMRTVTYHNTSDNPSAPVRGIDWYIRDSSGAQSPDTSQNDTTVNFTVVNDPPVLTVSGAIAYNENQAPTAPASSVNIVDPDDTNLESATIQISANFQAGEDVLTFTNTPAITGNFVGGTLTLTGTATVADYIAALQSINYVNGSENPNMLQRTLTWRVNDGTVDSNLPTTTIDVTAVNDGPVNTLPVPQATNEDTPLILVGPLAISVADVDSDPDDIQITLNVTNGTVSLNGPALGALTSVTGDGTNTVVAAGTAAEINAALAGMTFNPTPDYFGAASIQIVTDDLGNNPSGNLNDTDSLAITVNSVNDPPVLTATGVPTFNENGAAVNIAAAANITDTDDANIESATIQITANFQGGADVLTFVNTANITGNFAGDTLTLTGSDTLANYIAALQSITYSNTSENPSTAQRTLTWTVNDGDDDSNTQTTTVDVTATNDGPVHTLPGGVPSTNEDTDLGGLVFSIADGDSGTNDLDVQITVTNGVVTLPTIAGMSNYIAGDGTLDAFIHFQGPLSAWNNALNGIVFRPNLNFSGTASIQIVTSDQGFSGAGGPLADDDTLNITVNAVNDPPLNAVPGAQSIAENTTLQFTGPTAITISDTESATAEVTLTAANGVISLGGTTGLTFTLGADGTSSMTFNGTIAAINTAMSGMRFAANVSYHGTTASLAIDTSDQGNTGAGGVQVDSDTVDITVTPVNDAPSNVIPTGTTAPPVPNPGGTGNAIALDSDANGNVFYVDGSAAMVLKWQPPAGPATTVATGIAGPNDLAVDKSGNVFFAASAANTVRKWTAPAGPVTTVISTGLNQPRGIAVDTAGNLYIVDSGTSTIKKWVAPNGPLVTLTATSPLVDAVAVDDKGNVYFSEFLPQLIRKWAAPNGPVTTVVSSVQARSLDLDGAGNIYFTDYSSSVRKWSAVTSSTTLLATTNGGGTVLGVTLDPSGGLYFSQNITDFIRKFDGPSIDQDTPFVMNAPFGLQVSDIDAVTLQVTLTATNGTMTLNGTAGLTFTSGTGTADAAMTFNGTPAAINAALNGMQFNPTPAYFGPASIQIFSEDLGETGTPGPLTDTDTLNITVIQVNQPPVNGVPGAQTFDEDTTRTFSPGNGNLVSVSDPDAGGATVQVQLTVVSGTLTLSGTAGLSFSFSDGNGTGAGDGTSDATMTFRGTIASINTALNGLVYTPNMNFNGVDLLTIVTNDLGNTGPGGPKSDTDNITLNVTAVNDAPVLVNPASVNATEDIQFSFTAANTISVTDVDSGAGTNFQATLSVTNGTINVAGGGVSGNGTNSVTITGTVANVNAALGTVQYTGNLDFNGTDTLVVTVNDNGQTGGGNLSDTDNITINISAVNDPPVNGFPGTQTFNEDTTLTFSTGNGNAISVSDADVASGNLTVTLTTTAGTMTFGSTAGLSGITNNAATISGTGTLTDINNALQGLVFTPTLNLNGAQTIGMTTSDLGNTGSGGTQTDNDTINLSMTAVNDAPELTNPASVNATEDVQFSFTAGNLISVTDVDSGAGTNFQATLTASFGTINVTGAGVTGNNSASVTITGTVTAVNTILGTAKYTGNLNFNGTDTLVVTVNDNGQTGTGGNLSDTDNITINVAAVNDPPVALAKNFNAQAHMTIQGLTGLLTGVTDPDNGTGPGPCVSTTFTLVSITPTNGGGTATITDFTTGTFDFHPAAGFTGNATLDYVVEDTGCPAPAAQSAPATITIAVAGPLIYFVKSAGVGTADCRLGSECTLATALTNIGANTGRHIFISDANTHTPGVAVTLNSNGRLKGQGVTPPVDGDGVLTDDFDDLFDIAPPAGTIARPSINQARPTISGATTVTMHNNSHVRGLNLNTSNASSLAATGRTGLIVDDINVTSTNNTAANYAVDLGTSSGVFTLGDVTANTGTNGSGGVRFSSTTSTSTVTINNITTKAGIALNTSSTGTTDFTLNDVTSTTGSAVSITTATGDFTFHAVNANGATKGISVNSATGTFTINGSGTTDGTGGTIQNCTQRGAEFISSNNVTLRNMNLTNNGTAGAGGDDGNCSLDTGLNTACHAGVHLQLVNTALLNNLAVTDGNQIGINGDEVDGFTLQNSDVLRNGDEVGEAGLQIEGVTGTYSITGNTFTDNAGSQIELINYNTAGSPTGNITVNNNSLSFSNFPGGAQIGNTPPAGMTEQALFAQQFTTGTMTITITNTQFTRIWSAGIQVDGENGGNVIANIGVEANRVTNGPNTFTNCGLGPTISGAHNGTMDFFIKGNTMTNNTAVTGTAVTTQIVASRSQGSTGTWTGQIRNNVIGNGTTGSGCYVVGCNGIEMNNIGISGLYHIEVTGNQVNNVNGSGILGNHTSGSTAASGQTTFVITGNTIQNPERFAGNPGDVTAAGNAINLTNGDNIDDTGAMCAEISGNTLNGHWGNGQGVANDDSIRIRRRTTAAGSFKIRNYAPDGTPDDAEAMAFVASQNVFGAGTVDQAGSSNNSVTAPQFSGGVTACP